jgi:hypothetical protein
MTDEEDRRPPVGTRVRALVRCIDDLSEDGLGVYTCAEAGEELIVRAHSKYSIKRIHVSHPWRTDNSFSVDEGEYEIIVEQLQLFN